MRITFSNCDHCGIKGVKCVSTEGIMPMNTCKNCDITGSYIKLTTYKPK